MDLSSSGRKKSLDQLLEKAMAERSREDDQVEVTYEMREEYPCEQRTVRLKPEETVTRSNHSDRDDVNETEGEFGSVQMDRKVLKSTVILSIAMIFCFSGFSVVQSLLSTVIPYTGLQTLAILYLVATLSCFFAPIVTQKVGPKWTMCCSALSPVLLVIAFHYTYPIALFIAALVIGISLGLLYRAHNAYLFRNISRLSFLTQAIRSKMQQRYLRFFFVISKSYYFWGHIFATIIMEVSYKTATLPQWSVNETSEHAMTVVRRIDICTRIQCKNSFLATELSERKTNDQNSHDSQNFVSTNVTELFIYVFTAASFMGFLLMIIFLERLEVLLEQDPLERSLLYQTFRQIKLLIVDRNVRLVVLIIIFTGVEQAFIFGDFTRDYISCALGLESIAFTMTCLGGCHTLGSIGVHVFSQHFQRPIIMAAGLVCQSGLLMVLWLWMPVKDDAAVFYVIAGGWGLCNAIWETLSMSFLTTTYPDDWQTPVCVYYLLQWFGMAVTYSISNWLCPHIKILILAVTLAVSIIPYTILEFRLHHRNHIQNRTAML